MSHITSYEFEDRCNMSEIFKVPTITDINTIQINIRENRMGNQE